MKDNRTKSQWDFGELFKPAAARRVYSVSELTGSVRRLLEKEIGLVWVAGEITNLREQSSGHIYFSLKDAGAQLQCVCFRNEARAARPLLKDGQKVLLQGDLTVYEARGQYQLIVRIAEAQGVGALQLAFEQLKQKLKAEGLFAAERKRPLPRFAQRIGLVTSPTAAALRDV
ncbi:MAG: exodeoxyribonuclease VII large subunit, partial [Verrucomicrobia bacterium]|nr:exodeoxyribonuclease VII large subunit [Verrucomicrobiota bacterium]